MDLSTTYLGLKLPHPFMPGASPMVDRLDVVRRLEDAGASAIVMHSLFEEQILHEELGTMYAAELTADSNAEALTYMPRPDEFQLGPTQYLEHVARIRKAVGVPVIASLNGSTSGGWLHYARLIEEAGAHALELNIYFLAADPAESGEAVDRRVIDLVQAVRRSIRIPLAVKLSPFYSGLAHLAGRLDACGADGIVLFNRFYQPDIDTETLEITPTLRLSDSSELLLRLRWLAILSGRVKASLALSGGVHTVEDAVKGIMAGADAVQLVSVLLRRGPEYLAQLKTGLTLWLEEHEYESLGQLKGSMNSLRCPDPRGFERANYMKVLSGWKFDI